MRKLFQQGEGEREERSETRRHGCVGSLAVSTHSTTHLFVVVVRREKKIVVTIIFRRIQSNPLSVLHMYIPDPSHPHKYPSRATRSPQPNLLSILWQFPPFPPFSPLSYSYFLHPRSPLFSQLPLPCTILSFTTDWNLR